MKQDQTQGQEISLQEQRDFARAGERETRTARPDSVERRVRRCANCDIEFFWSPTIVQDRVYCCAGCAAGGPCTCDYSLYRSVTIMGVIYYEQ